MLQVISNSFEDHEQTFFAYMNNNHKHFSCSWLSLNWRVLHVAMDQRTPLHERLRFLGIAAASLDEFFECRVASLKWKEAVSQDASVKQGTRGCPSLQERLKNISL